MDDDNGLNLSKELVKYRTCAATICLKKYFYYLFSEQGSSFADCHFIGASFGLSSKKHSHLTSLLSKC